MPAPAEPMRLVQVGAGAMGRTWLTTIAESPAATLVGLADLDLQVARRAADDAGFRQIPVAGSLAELLDRLEADGVVNVTVPAAHRETSIVALDRGLPVLCEKPLAESVSAGLSMVASAERSGRLLMVSQSRRYWRALAAYRRQIAQLGPIGTVGCTFLRAPHFGGFREDMPYPLLIDMAIHQFDLARDLIGREPVAVYCESYNPSWSWYAGDAAAEAVFEFAGGSRFAFSGSWCAPGAETSWNGQWVVSGAGGSAIWDGDHPSVATDAAGQPIEAAIGTDPEQTAGSLAEFVDAVQTGRVPSAEARRNVLSLAMVEAAIRSAQEGRRVLIAEILADAYASALDSEHDFEIRAVLKNWGSVHRAVPSDDHE